MRSKPVDSYEIVTTSIGQPILPTLRETGVELDQRLARAFDIAARYSQVGSLRDSCVFHALLTLNSSITWRTNIEQAIAGQADNYRKWLWLSDENHGCEPYSVSANIGLRYILRRALTVRAQEQTLGTGDFFRAVALQSIESGHLPLERPHTLDLLLELFEGDRHLPLSRSSRVQAYLQELLSRRSADEDFQFIVTLSEGNIAFRSVSTLGDFTQQTDAGLLVPKRVLLTHFQDQFGGFTQEEIEELESLLNDKHAKEAAFQAFFETHPHFFRRWDYREVHPHVILSREDAGPLIPDFVLTDRELQKAAIVELKLPRTIVRRQKNRDRFAAAVNEARTQLLRYRDWFEERDNRKMLKRRLGMEVYRPQLAVVIGRASAFLDEFDRQRLSADNPDLDIVTYDDLLVFAKRRRLLIAGDKKTGNCEKRGELQNKSMERDR